MISITQSLGYRRLKKLVTSPERVLYNLLAKRAGLAQFEAMSDDGATGGNALELALKAGANPWQVLADRFDLRSGAVTGQADQSFLLDSRKLLAFALALFELSRHHGTSVSLYVPGVHTETWAAGQIPRPDLLQTLMTRVFSRSDFVVELRSPEFHTVAAHVFVYDCDEAGNCVHRSIRAFLKKHRRDAMWKVYPPPLLGSRGSILARSPFPIDVVYTWVDKSDPQWQQLWSSVHPQAALDSDRYTSNDELLYSLRSVAKHAPWVRNVYVVTNCARPAFLDEASPVIWTPHEQVFPNAAALPTFNSHAIEACLHNIPGLSEHFVYFNDDVMLNQPCFPSDFFDEAGRSRAYLEPYGMVSTELTDGSADYLVAARNSARLLKKIGVPNARQLHHHTPQALRVSTLREMERKFAAAFEKTRAARLRSKSDVNVTSFLYHHYALSVGHAVPAEARSLIVRPVNIKKALAPSGDSSYKFLCFNDGNNSSEDSVYKTAAMQFYARRLGEACKYELGAAGADPAPAAVDDADANVTVITYGTFDLFHEGHVRLLQRARALGSRLLVGLSTDEFNRLKGKSAYMSYEQRKRILEACKYVDQVFPEENWGQKTSDVERYKADIFVMGSDWAGKFDELRSQCQVVYLDRTEEVSTTQIKRDLGTPTAPVQAAAPVKPAPRFDGDPAVNFVFLSASENLRALEVEFADGISAQLDGFRSTSQIRKRAVNAVNVTFWIHRPANIIMSHGVADKNYLTRRREGKRLINKYDRVLVPGPWLKRKILATKGVELDPNAIDIVGWPRLDALLRKQAQMAPAEPDRSRLRVLWAPTHTGRPRASSNPALVEHAALLESLFDYQVSAHPNERKGGKPTFQGLLDCDVVIADQGTMLYEAWALGKTVVCPAWLVSEGIQESMPGSAEAYIYQNKIGLHAGSIDELVDMIRNASGPGPNVREFLDSYLEPTAIGRSYELIADSVRAVWQMGAVRPPKP